MQPRYPGGPDLSAGLATAQAGYCRLVPRADAGELEPLPPPK